MGRREKDQPKNGEHSHETTAKALAEIEKRVLRVERIVAAHRAASEVERRPRLA